MSIHTITPSSSRSTPALIGALGLLALTTLSLSGCGFDAAGCVDDSECRTGRVCFQGTCQDASVRPDLGVDMTIGEDLGGPDMSAPDMSQPPVDMDPGFDLGPPPVDMDPGFDLGPPVDMDPGFDQGPPPDMGVDMPPAQDMGVDMPLPVDMGVDMPPMQDMGPDMPPPPDMGPDMPPVVVLGPQIKVTPLTEIDFGNVAVNTTAQTAVLVENIGDAPLTITSLDLESRPSQGFDVAPVVSAAQVIAPGASATFTATFSPTVQGNYGNGIVILSDDADDPQLRVDLGGQGIQQTSRSCLFSSPDAIDFGVVAPGQSRQATVTVGNCGANDTVTVTGFSLDDPNIGFSVSGGPQVPFTLAVGQSQQLTVTFAPSAPQDASTRLEIRNDSELSPRSRVDLDGSGGGCATAVARGESVNDTLGPDALREESVAIVSGDSVQLDATDSSAPSGQVGYSWAITSAPAGSTATLSATTGATPTFAPTVVGRYTIALTVTDLITGASQCDPEEITVSVLPPTPFARVELSWQANQDFDLHILRSAGNSFPGLGDAINDLHYDNLETDWGQPSVIDADGFHFGDDRSGPGTERAVLTGLESNRRYRVVVRYSDRRSFNPPTFDATVKLTTFDAAGQQQVQTFTQTFNLSQQGREWTAFEIDGATGTIVP